MKVGQWTFCLTRRHDFSGIYVDYHKVFEGYLQEYLFDMCQMKTGLNFSELEILFREKI